MEVARVVTGDCAGAPGARVQVPLAVINVAADPQCGQFRRSTVLAVDGEAGFFQPYRNEVTHRLAGAVGVGPDEEGDFHRSAVVVPLAVDKLSAHGGHFLVQHFHPLVAVRGILHLVRADQVDVAAVFRETSNKGEHLIDGLATVDLLVDEVAVDQPVHRFADAHIRERVQLAGDVSKFWVTSRVEGDLVIQTVLEGVFQTSIGDRLEVLRGGKVGTVDINGASFDLRNCRVCAHHGQGQGVNPGTGAGGRLFHRLIGRFV